MISFWLEIPPVAKGRPRLGRYGNAYTPEDTRQFENTVRRLAWSHRPSEPIAGPVQLLVTFYLSKPKRPKCEYPITKPDFDNLAKAISDSLNGIMWKDDSQVVDAHVFKRYAKGEPRIFVSLAIKRENEELMSECW